MATPNPRNRKNAKKGYLTLYHRTTPQAAKAIYRDGKFSSKIRTQFGTEVYFSNRVEGQGDGYGEGIVAVEIPPQYANLSDEFPDGTLNPEQHYWIRSWDIQRHGKLVPPKSNPRKRKNSQRRNSSQSEAGLKRRLATYRKKVQEIYSQDDLLKAVGYLDKIESWAYQNGIPLSMSLASELRKEAFATLKAGTRNYTGFG